MSSSTAHPMSIGMPVAIASLTNGCADQSLEARACQSPGETPAAFQLMAPMNAISSKTYSIIVVMKG